MGVDGGSEEHDSSVTGGPTGGLLLDQHNAAADDFREFAPSSFLDS
jgi:hypothetical protein